MTFQATLWSNQPGKYFCLSTKSKSGKWGDHWFTRDEFDDIPGFLEQHAGDNIYACPHGFSQKRRLKDYAINPRLLYADLDEIDPRRLKIRPTIAIQSSPGRYVGYWLTDKIASEELNRRLTRAIGADRGGWDRTQVLRVPETRNYKYDTLPKVRVLWLDGPTYEVAKLERELPDDDDGGDTDGGDAAEVLKRYESRIPRRVRQELLNGKPKVGKRSEVLWKLQNELLEAGMTRDEAFTLLWSSPWNKFADRRGGEKQLRRELDKAVQQHLKGRNGTHVDEELFNPLPRSMADVEIENIEWVIPGWLARKELTIIEGDPGLGKSYLMQMVAMAIGDGKRIPTEKLYRPVKGRVAYFDTENTSGSVTKMRLVENGMENLENYWQGEEPFSVDDEERWEKVIAVLDEFKPVLIVFDTINIYIGGADTHKSSETQQALARFKQLGNRLNCAVAILRHLTKGGKDKAIYRGQGSIAMTGLARIVLTVGQMPDDPETRVVAVTKINIAKKAKSITFRIEGLPDTRDLKNRSKLVWGDFVDLTSEDIIERSTAEKEDTKAIDQWLLEVLAEGPVEYSKIARMGEARSFAERNIRRARERLGIQFKRAPGNRTMWISPE